MEGLPVVESVIEPKDIDFTKYRKIGEEHTKIIEFEPGKLYVLDIVRPKYALINQNSVDQDMPAIVIAPMPLLPIYKGSAGSTLIAELLLQKYVHHLPFYRQTKQFKELGLKLSATTINDWFASSCDLIKPLYEKIRETVLSSNYLQADETTLPVINREKKRADKEYLWMARAVKEKLLFFDYRDGSRSIKAVREIFKDFKGTLQTDGYCAYEIFDKDPSFVLIRPKLIERIFTQQLNNLFIYQLAFDLNGLNCPNSAKTFCFVEIEKRGFIECLQANKDKYIFSPLKQLNAFWDKLSGCWLFSSDA